MSSNLYTSPSKQIGNSKWRIVVKQDGQVEREYNPPYKSGMDGWWPEHSYTTMLDLPIPQEVQSLDKYFVQQICNAKGLSESMVDLPLFA